MACGTAISALELLACRGHFRTTGVFSVEAVATFHRHALVLRAVDRALPAVLAVQAIGSAALIVLGPFSPAGRGAVVLALSALTLVRWRRLAGGDGAEQFAAIALVAAALAVLPAPSIGRVQAAVVFIGAQVVLSYVTAGTAKLTSPMWRRGEALPAILATHTHGHPWAADVVRRYAPLAILAAWAVIIFECAFPLLMLGPDTLVLAGLALGVGFHVSCAVWMGLNSFLWSFPAAYPCVLVAATFVKTI